MGFRFATAEEMGQLVAEAGQRIQPEWPPLLRASLEGDDYRQDWLMQEEYAQHKRLAASPWDPGEAAWMLTL